MFRLNLQAAVAAGGDAEAALGGGALADAGFLNELQAGVAAWVKEVQKVTTLHASHAVGAPQPGAARREVAFWGHLEAALAEVQSQLDGAGVRLTLGTLKRANRALATVLFASDTGVAPAVQAVANYQLLMKDLAAPLDAVMTAPTVKKLGAALADTFERLRKLKYADQYVRCPGHRRRMTGLH